MVLCGSGAGGDGGDFDGRSACGSYDQRRCWPLAGHHFRIAMRVTYQKPDGLR